MKTFNTETSEKMIEDPNGKGTWIRRIDVAKELEIIHTELITMIMNRIKEVKERFKS